MWIRSLLLLVCLAGCSRTAPEPVPVAVAAAPEVAHTEPVVTAANFAEIAEKRLQIAERLERASHETEETIQQRARLVMKSRYQWSAELQRHENGQRMFAVCYWTAPEWIGIKKEAWHGLVITIYRHEGGDKYIHEETRNLSTYGESGFR